MSQTELATAAGMTANNLSRLENPDYGKHTITSLKRIAEALDVALVVRLVPFSQLVDWLSGTPRLDNGLDSAALAVPSFDDDPELNAKPSANVDIPITRYSVFFNGAAVGPASPFSLEYSFQWTKPVTYGFAPNVNLLDTLFYPSPQPLQVYQPFGGFKQWVPPVQHPSETSQ